MTNVIVCCQNEVTAVCVLSVRTRAVLSQKAVTFDFDAD